MPTVFQVLNSSHNFLGDVLLLYNTLQMLKLKHKNVNLPKEVTKVGIASCL